MHFFLFMWYIYDCDQKTLPPLLSLDTHNLENVNQSACRCQGLDEYETELPSWPYMQFFVKVGFQALKAEWGKFVVLVL